MVRNAKIEIEKFNGQSFDMWKLKLEDLLVDKYQWITVDPGTKSTTMSAKYWAKLDWKAKITIRLCLKFSTIDCIRGASMKVLCDKLGTLYQSKYLVNKHFLWKKLHSLRMKYGDLVTENLNTFNTIVSQLLSIHIKISYEDKCLSLLCYRLDSWDSLVFAIGRNTIALQSNEIVSSFPSEEMRQKNIKGQNGDVFFA